MELGEHKGSGIRYAMHLSAPKGGSAQMLRDPDGGWVSWEDYARLKAEVERLRKAGDAMELTLQADFNGCPYEPLIVIQSIHYWRAAKEGKPSKTKSPSFIEDLGNGIEKHDLLFRYPAKEGKPSV